MKNKLKKISTVLMMCIALLSMEQTSYAEERACSELGGGVIFKDMMYGLGTGAVLTALAIVAVDSGGNEGQKIAVGSLMGAGIGVGVGIYETLGRTCTPVASGWQKPNMYFSKAKSRTQDQNGYGLSLTYVMQ